MQKLYEITVGQKHKNLYKLKNRWKFWGQKVGHVEGEEDVW
jgi:hypothetical protein